ncbi:uncharacterized protein BO80DRAFT_110858 [Aspergillus ibericus CBS 121593]|uniref:Uncharacterized protein n=1 Tax=Aspergillus ibericus CBS 121593 TaxID=1448316 RepID=A0A395GWM2_9EURO|nr:hypothetical protein BO80DRAFT_110858 [Aspergillus ibericus CBS 121593]RAK99925.1 hypothetical protein BO80DRAFT_110858 [Aspergillus ibericus CBS 121593]
MQFTLWVPFPVQQLWSVFLGPARFFFPTVNGKLYGRHGTTFEIIGSKKVDLPCDTGGPESDNTTLLLDHKLARGTVSDGYRAVRSN